MLLSLLQLEHQKGTPLLQVPSSVLKEARGVCTCTEKAELDVLLEWLLLVAFMGDGLLKIGLCPLA